MKLIKPFKLVFSQQFENLTEARRIEYKLKKHKNKVIIERIIKDKYIKMAV